MAAKPEPAGAASAAPAESAEARTRRLRFEPIDQALKEENYRKVVQLCERKEVAGIPLAKAFKAIAYARSNDLGEAMKILEDVIRSKPTDAPTINMTLAALRDCREYDRLVAFIESTMATLPADAPGTPTTTEELLREMCGVHVKREDYKALQMAAMRLVKATGKPAYHAWVALALHVQASPPVSAADAAAAFNPATSAPGDAPAVPAPLPVTGGGRGYALRLATTTGETTMLRLAERLLTQAMDKQTGADRTGEALGLYVHTLVRQGRAKEALEAVVASGGKYAHTITDAPPAAAAGAAAAADGDDKKADAAAPAPPVGAPASTLGPLQPVDVERYRAYLLTLAGEDWAAAAAAYGGLLTGHYDGEDWACHQGLAYAVARRTVAELTAGAGGALATATPAKVAELLGPLPAAAGAPISGVADLDATFLRPVLEAALASASGAGATSAPAAAAGGKRGPLLSLLQLVAVRLEIASRALCVPALPAALATAVRAAGSAAVAQYVALLVAYLKAFGTKACAFSDVQAFLTPLLPRLAPAMRAALLPYSADAAPAAAGGDAAILLAFTQAAAAAAPPTILAMPFSPVVPAGSASDAATPAPLFRWAFTPADFVPAAAASDAAGVAAETASLISALGPLAAYVTGVRAADAPSEAAATRLLDVIAAGHEAALKRNAAAKAPAATPAAAGSGAAAGAAAAAGEEEEEGDFGGLVAGGAKKKGTGKDKKGADKKGAAGKKEKGGAAAGDAAAAADGDDKKAAAPAAAPAAAAASTAAKSAAPGGGDPHRVSDILQPKTSDLLFTGEQDAAITAAKNAVRRYVTACQVGRYLGLIGLRSAGAGGFTNALAGSAVAIATDEAAVRAEADALAKAWGHCAPLTLVASASSAVVDAATGNVVTAPTGGHMEVQEADDLLLLAAHLLQECALAKLAGADAAPAPGAPSPADSSLASVLAARSLLLEACLLLDVGAELSPNSARLRYAAMRCYGFIGANASIIGYTGSPYFMRPKHIQRDTLSHVGTPHYTRLVWNEALQNNVTETLKLHREMRGANHEHARISLLSGHFSNALDFLRLHARLAQSGTLATHKSLHGLVLLHAGGRTYNEAASTLRKIVVTGEYASEAGADTSIPALLRLRDNDDREVFASWDTPSIPQLHEARHGWAFPSLSATAAGAVTGAAAAAGGSLLGVPVSPDSGVWVYHKFATAAAEATAAMLRANGVAGVPAGGAAALSPALYALLGPLCGGANGGGAYERLLRRVNRDGALLARAASMKALAAADGDNAETAAAAVNELAALFTASGLLDAPAAAASADASGDPLARAVTARLLSEWSSNCVPLVDTAISSERVAMRSGCAQLLLAAARAALACATARTAASTGASAAAAAGLKGPAAAAATAAAGAAADAAWASAEKALASASGLVTSLTADALSQRMYPINTATGEIVAAAPTTSAAGAAGGKAGGAAGKGTGKADARVTQPVNSAAMAELTLLAQHTLLFVAIGTHYAARATGGGKKRAEALAAAKKGGKPAAGAATTAAAAAAAPSAGAAATTAPASDAVVPFTAGAGAVAAAHDAASGFLFALSTALASLDKDLTVMKASLEVNVDKAAHLIIGGFKADACATALAKALAGEYYHRQAAKGPAERERVEAEAAAVSAAAARGPGARYVVEALQRRGKASRDKIEHTVVHIGASYTNTVQKVNEEVAHRQALLKDVA